MKDMFSLKGKVAIVTGGNGGLGLGIARGFASVGGDIVIAARNAAKSAKAGEGIRKDFGVKVLEVEVDVRQEKQIQALVKKVLDTFSRIDVLVNNAGVNIRALLRPPDYEYDEVLEINLRSAYRTSKYVYPAMKKAGGGKIINIGSMIIFGGESSLPTARAKGIVAMTCAMAVGWATDNIQVNAILPGWIDTEMTRRAHRAGGLNEKSWPTLVALGTLTIWPERRSPGHRCLTSSLASPG
jgi:2-deoxy-D-gluconate 3-dehydrogenase